MRKIIKKSLALLLSLLMIITAVPLMTPVFAATVTLNSDAHGVVVSGDNDRYSGGNMNIVNDGTDAATDAGILRFSLAGITDANTVENVKLNVKADSYSTNTTSDLAVNFYYSVNTVCDQYCTNGTNKKMYWGSGSGETAIDDYLPFFGVNKNTDLLGSNPQNSTANKQIDITDAFRSAVRRGAPYFYVILMTNKSEDTGDWSDAHYIASEQTITYDTVAADVTDTSLKAQIDYLIDRFPYKPDVNSAPFQNENNENDPVKSLCIAGNLIYSAQFGNSSRKDTTVENAKVQTHFPEKTVAFYDGVLNDILIPIVFSFQPQNSSKYRCVASAWPCNNDNVETDSELFTLVNYWHGHRTQLSFTGAWKYGMIDGAYIDSYEEGVTDKAYNLVNYLYSARSDTNHNSRNYKKPVASSADWSTYANLLTFKSVPAAGANTVSFGYYTGDNAASDLHDQRNLGTIYVVDYTNIKNIATQVKSTYATVKANEADYCPEKLTAYYQAVLNIVGLDPSAYNYASDIANATTSANGAIADAYNAYGTRAVNGPEDHTYTAQTVKADALKSAATCTVPDTYYFSCALCGRVENDDSHTFTNGATIPHTYTAQTVKADALKSAATCTVPATYYYSCSVCGAVEGDDSHTFTNGDTIPHTYTAQTVKADALKSAATCTVPATYYYSCSVCGTVESDDSHTFTNGDTDPHPYTAQTVKADALKSAATCTVPATYYYSCSVCGAVESNDSHTFTNGDTIPHTWTETESYLKDAATCSSNAIYWKECSTCHSSANGIADETWEKSGTQLAHLYGAPTWEWTGFTSAKATFTCTRTGCGHSEEAVAAINDDGAAATCTEDATKVYTAAVTFNGTEYTTTKDELLTKTGHDFTGSYVSNGNGTHSRECVNPGCTATGIGTTAELSQTCTDWTYENENSTTHKKTCNVCGYEMSEGHTYDGENLSWNWADDCSSATAEFTCTAAGCENKNEVTAAISVTGGSPTCTAGATKTYTATVTLNGTTYRANKEMSFSELGHTWTETESYLKDAATCSSNAIYWKECSTCHSSAEGVADETWEKTGTKLTHVYGEPTTWMWSGVTSATAIFSCSNGCGEQQFQAASEITNDGKEADCTEYVETVYTAKVTFEGHEYTGTKTVTLDPVGHEWEDTRANLKEPASCTSDAVYYKECSRCHASSETYGGATWTDEGTLTGHSYDAPEWIWTGYTAATAKFSCKNEGCTHYETVAADLRDDGAVAACTGDVIKTYTATVTFDDVDYTDEAHETLTAIAHTPGAALQANGDGTHSTVCSVCGYVIETVACEWDEGVETVLHTQSTDGVWTYTCTLCGNTKTETKTVHTWGEVEVITPATCETAGIESAVCTVCSLHQGDISISKLGHLYNAASYQWEGASCTATKVCGRDGCTDSTANHTVRETVSGVPTEKIPATCYEKGTNTYTATFTTVGFAAQTTDIQDIEKTAHTYSVWTQNEGTNTHTGICSVCPDTAEGHTTVGDCSGGSAATCVARSVCDVCHSGYGEYAPHDLTHEAAQAPTCLEPGHIEYWHCNVCEKDFSDSTAATEITSVLASHTPGEEKKENDVPSTCTVLGTYDTVVRCTICNTVISSEPHEYTELAPHNYDCENIDWTWTGYTAATAKFSCKNEGCTHYETVAADLSDDGTVAVCTGDVIKTYTATVTFDGVDYTDEAHETLAAIAHTYGTPDWTWTGYTAATAKFTCTADGCGHVENVTAEVTDNDAQATCKSDVTKIYTATVTVDGEKYTDTAEETLAALPHTYGAPVWVWTGYTEADARFTCTADGCGHVENVTATVSDDGKIATCREDVVKTYTASATFDSTDYSDSKTETLSAIAHTPVTVTGTPATCTENGLSDGEKCSVCGKILTAQTTLNKLNHSYKLVSSTDATCTTAGKKSYKCSRCSVTKNETVNALGHDFGAWELVVFATETENGIEKRYCSRCDAYEEREVLFDGDVTYRAVRFVAANNMHYNVVFSKNNVYTVYNSASGYWYANRSINFTVHTYSSYGFSDYIVYFNGTEVTPNADGSYTIPAGTEPVIVTVVGAIKDDSAPGGKLSFWELLLRFIRKVIAFFKGEK